MIRELFEGAEVISTKEIVGANLGELAKKLHTHLVDDEHIDPYSQINYNFNKQGTSKQAIYNPVGESIKGTMSLEELNLKAVLTLYDKEYTNSSVGVGNIAGHSFSVPYESDLELKPANNDGIFYTINGKVDRNGSFDHKMAKITYFFIGIAFKHFSSRLSKEKRRELMNKCTLAGRKVDDYEKNNLLITVEKKQLLDQKIEIYESNLKQVSGAYRN